VSEGTFSYCRPSVRRVVEQPDGRDVTIEQLRKHPWGIAARAPRDNRRP